MQLKQWKLMYYQIMYFIMYQLTSLIMAFKNIKIIWSWLVGTYFLWLLEKTYSNFDWNHSDPPIWKIVAILIGVYYDLPVWKILTFLIEPYLDPPTKKKSGIVTCIHQIIYILNFSKTRYILISVSVVQLSKFNWIYDWWS